MRDVAAILKLERRTIVRLMREGKLPGVKIGGSYRFLRSEIEAVLRGTWKSGDDK